MITKSGDIESPLTVARVTPQDKTSWIVQG